MKMKINLLAFVLGFITMSTFAQKNELKTAEKALKSQDFTTAISAITSAESLISSMDNKTKAKFYFLKGKALSGKKEFKAASVTFKELFDLENKTGKKRYSSEATLIKNQILQEVYQLASDQYTAKEYQKASDNFYLTYKLNPIDTSFIYNAAACSTLAKNYDLSLNYYEELKDLGYTGITTLYFATSIANDSKENLQTKSNRDLKVKLGLYKDPVDEVTESKYAEIIKNIGYIYVNQGKPELAIAALEEARKLNPKDVNLILNQAQMYIKLERMDKFGELMIEAVELDPTNPVLFFNLGVVNAKDDKIEAAIKFYKKAIELDPAYGDAYLNLGISMLAEEKAIVDEMNNNLSDFDKYDELQEKQKKLYEKALPYLIKADSIERTIDTVRMLLNIYDTLGKEVEADEIRPIYKKMRDQ